MEIFNLLSAKEQEYLQSVFAGCPKEIKDSMKVVKLDRNHKFIEAGEECRNVYVILQGKACGIDMQIQGKMYRFKEFKPGRFLGELECISNIPNYAITVQTVTPCVLLAMSSQQYLKWIKHDGNALFLQMQRLLFELTNQTKDDRRFFLSTCIERLIQYLVECYEKERQPDIRVCKSRDELANEIGFVVRTIDRNIKKLEKDEYISVHAGKVLISHDQYERMKIHLKKNYTYKED